MATVPAPAPTYTYSKRRRAGSWRLRQGRIGRGPADCTEPAPLTLYSPSIRLGFLGDRAAGGEVMTLADVRATEGTGLDLCNLADSLGADCQPCLDDDDPSCLPVSGFGWTAQKVDEPIDPDLAWCGVDFSDPDNVPEWNFDFTCETDGLCAASALGLALPFVWRRRRR